MGDDLSRTAPRSPISIQSLSPEILSEIFLHCLTDREITGSSRPPLLLCHVCSKWRRIALCTPRLWSSLSIKPSTRYLSRDVVEWRLIRLARFCMENAKDCTVSLHLTLTRAGSWAPESENNWRSLCNELLVRFLGRYHAISIHAPDFELNQLGAFSGAPAGQVQRLRTMKLHARTARRDDMISVFSSAPQLKRFVFGLQGYVIDDSWSNISQHFIPSLLPIPWGQLTHFCIRMPITIPVWYALFPQLHSLEQCVITLDADGYGENQIIKLSERPLILPNLVTLGLALIARARPVSFHGTEMPQLKKLHLSSLFPMNVPTLQWQRHIDALRNLTSLCLHRVGIDPHYLLDILEEMDQLEELTLSCDLHRYNVILEALTVDDTNPKTLVPCLQKFRIHVALDGNADVQFVPETFVRMIRSRWIPLTSIALISTKRIHYVRLGIFGGDPSLLAGIGSELAPLVRNGLAFEGYREMSPFPRPSDADITLSW